MISPADDVLSMRGSPQMQVRVSLRHLGLMLAAATMFFTTAGATVAVINFGYGHDNILGLFPLFDLGSDTSIPSWYASLTLLICSALLALHGVASRHIEDRRAFQWWLLAFIFLVLSLDETARLHETLGGQIGRHLVAQVGTAGGLFHFGWVLPGAVFAGVVAIIYLRFLLALPRGVRYGMLAAGAVFIGGAICVEMLNAREHSLHGGRSMRYQMGTVFEEFLEMAAIALFAHVLARYLGQRAGTVAMQILLKDPDRIVRPARRDPAS